MKSETIKSYHAKLRTKDGCIIDNYPVASSVTLPYGYINYYGDKLTNAQIDRYNAINARIVQRAKSGLIVDETDLDLRHKALVITSITAN